MVPFTVAQLNETKLEKKTSIKKSELSCYLRILHADGSVHMYYLKSDSTDEYKGIKEEIYIKENKGE